MRPRQTVLIEVPKRIEVLLERDAKGAWPRAPRLADVVNDAYAHPTFRVRLEELTRELASRSDELLRTRRRGSVVHMRLTPRLAAQLRALDQAQRQLAYGPWGAPEVAWDERDPQEQVFLRIRPVGALWKHAGRRKVKIRPKQRRTLPVSVRFPPELYEEVTAYAERLGSDRTYVIVECVRQALETDRAWKREWRRRTGG
jgi:hypothetical protein